MVEVLVENGMTVQANAIATDFSTTTDARSEPFSLLEIYACLANIEGVQRAGEDYLNSLDKESSAGRARVSASLAKAQARAGLVDEAREKSKSEALIGYFYDLAVREITNAYIRRNSFDDAQATINSLEDSEENRRTIISLLLTLASARMEKGEEQEALKLLTRTQELAQTVDPYPIPDWSFFVAKQYAELGLGEECAGWIGSLTPASKQASALIGLANGILDREQAAK
jgi:hypothetical protein